MKIILKIIFTILLCLIIIIIINIGYVKTKYSLNNIIKTIENVNLSNNIHIYKKINDLNGNTDYKIYIKNDIIKISQKTNYFDNTNENIDFDEYITKDSIITVNHNSKLLSEDKFEFKSLKDYLNNSSYSGNSYFLQLTNKDNYKFKYLGKINIDEKDCLKFSIININYTYIFYMELESNLIIKTEEYINKDNTLYSTTNYNYDLNFNDSIEINNLNNYKDYTKIPIEK